MFTKNLVGTKKHLNLYSNDDAREILAKIPDRCKFHMFKKMHHDIYECSPKISSKFMHK